MGSQQERSQVELYRNAVNPVKRLSRFLDVDFYFL